MKSFRIFLYGVWVLMASIGIAAAAETDVQGSSDHPLVQIGRASCRERVS
jgi:hypothetical protein